LGSEQEQDEVEKKAHALKEEEYVNKDLEIEE
jgi:hypothetical protein